LFCFQQSKEEAAIAAAAAAVAAVNAEVEHAESTVDESLPPPPPCNPVDGMDMVQVSHDDIDAKDIEADVHMEEEEDLPVTDDGVVLGHEEEHAVAI
jgi:hypothetical protein